MVMEQSDLANKISELCLNFYNKLPNGNKYKASEWTILSAICMQRDTDKFDIVSMGTGTKCIGANMLTANGDILNDSHAEVLARRAFIRFLLHQISCVKDNNSDAKSIFQLDEKNKRFKLMENVKFHMFTTSTPCGDASIYATNDNQDEPDTKRIKLNDTLPDGFTGAKLMFDEDVEDPMEQTEGKIRIKPGKGDRTMSLSCSDKIARWNLVGIQGCMLSSLIDPIYVETIVLADGTPYNQNAMERASWRRFVDAEKFLDFPFKLNKPKILIANNKMKFKFARNDKERINPSANSIIYCQLPEKMKPIEVSVSGKRQGVTKKHLLSRKAHLKISKIELFTEYMNILSEFSELKLHLYSNTINFDDLCYKDIKTLPKNEYYLQWKRLREGLLPNWTTKNDNLSNFKSFFCH
ncbi:tRNA-specific adenosine deaminase 1 [Chironomus tepperi]|uniref:tRNA-specific adenosine deaminase 1 n=1 Tax=Chironomus tepperi TaxID=113505 RepID=UPI00391F2EE9